MALYLKAFVLVKGPVPLSKADAKPIRYVKDGDTRSLTRDWSWI